MQIRRTSLVGGGGRAGGGRRCRRRPVPPGGSMSECAGCAGRARALLTRAFTFAPALPRETIISTWPSDSGRGAPPAGGFWKRVPRGRRTRHECSAPWRTGAAPFNPTWQQRGPGSACVAARGGRQDSRGRAMSAGVCVGYSADAAGAPSDGPPRMRKCAFSVALHVGIAPQHPVRSERRLFAGLSQLSSAARPRRARAADPPQ